MSTSSARDWTSDQSSRESDAGRSTQSDKSLKPRNFVEWAPDLAAPPQKTPLRLYHKKSRTGCAQCRARRVKCDEVHPICGNCLRHTGQCVYDRSKTSTSDPSSSNLVDRTVRPSESGSILKIEPRAREIPQERERNLLELKLLHRWMSDTSTTFTVYSNNIEEQRYWWTVASTQKAFEHAALLDFIFAFTALHWSKLEPGNREVADAHRKYMDLALSGHREDVAHLCKKNADAVCLTSGLVRASILSECSTRELEPYTPPSVWLETTQVSGQIWVSSWDWIKDDEASVSGALFKATPALLDPALMFHANNRRGLGHLLRSNIEDDATELANPEIVIAYETTLSYIGGIKRAVAAEQPKVDIFKRMISFPMWINRKFTPLVDQQQPRALVVLCHYFALLTIFKDIWWIGDMGEREIRVIEKILPQRWLSLMAWPLRVLEEPLTLTLGSIEDSLQFPEVIGVEIGSQQSIKKGPADLAVPFGAGFRGE